MNAQSTDEKSGEVEVAMPPSGQTPASIEAGNSSLNPEADREVATYLHGWPLHTLSLASVFAPPLKLRSFG